jgi:hypothetical protein
VMRGSLATGPGYAGTRTAAQGSGLARWTLDALARVGGWAEAVEGPTLTWGCDPALDVTGTVPAVIAVYCATLCCIAILPCRAALCCTVLHCAFCCKVLQCAQSKCVSSGQGIMAGDPVTCGQPN